MKNLVDFLFESKGADIKDRTADRFYGDKLNRPRDLKTRISKTIKTLKKLKEFFTEEEFEMLMKLADNSQERYDDRSYIEVYYGEKYNYYTGSFDLTMTNMPKSIQKQLSTDVIKKNIPSSVHINISGNSFGTTGRVRVYLNNEPANEEEFAAAFKYVLKVISPVFDDILNYKDDYKDDDQVKSREWRNKKVSESMSSEDLTELEEVIKVFINAGGMEKLEDKLADASKGELSDEVKKTLDKYDEYMEDVLWVALQATNARNAAKEIKDMAEDNEMREGTEAVFALEFLQEIQSILGL